MCSRSGNFQKWHKRTSSCFLVRTVFAVFPRLKQKLSGIILKIFQIQILFQIYSSLFCWTNLWRNTHFLFHVLWFYPNVKWQNETLQAKDWKAQHLQAPKSKRTCNCKTLGSLVSFRFQIRASKMELRRNKSHNPSSNTDNLLLHKIST